MDQCLTWTDFLRLPRPRFSRRKHLEVCQQIEEAELALSENLVDYFLNRFPGIHRARVFGEFCRVTGFLDCETTGIARGSYLTVVTVYDGVEARSYVRGRDLSLFLRELKRFDLLVTFNGGRFDLPCLRRQFGLDIRIPHLDVMPIVRAMGCRGSLKKCASCLGFRHRYQQLTGEDAVRLWYKYSGDNDSSALEALIKYNREDTRLLERLLTKALDFSMSSYPVAWRLQSS